MCLDSNPERASSTYLRGQEAGRILLHYTTIVWSSSKFR